MKKLDLARTAVSWITYLKTHKDCMMIIKLSWLLRLKVRYVREILTVNESPSELDYSIEDGKLIFSIGGKRMYVRSDEIKSITLKKI